MDTNTVQIDQVKIDPNNAGFGTGASDIIIPKTNNIFGKPSTSSFLADMKVEEDAEAAKTQTDIVSDLIPKNALQPAKDADTENFLKDLREASGLPKEDTEEQEGTDTETTTEPAKAGRPKTDKNLLVNYLKEKIEAKEYETYEDYDEKVPLEEYLNKLPENEIKGLLDSNLKAKEDSMREELRKEVFESLPGSLQYAAAAVSRGATEHDLQDIYAALLRVEQSRALDITDENDQEIIALNYLQATNFGNAAIIKEQVEEWKAAGTLEKKAKTFKPALDNMQEQQVRYQLQQQEDYNRQQAELQQYYTQSVYTTLKKGEVGGLKLDKKKQQEFYDGLTNVRQSALTGKPVNSLGAKLEEIQFSDKPDFDLLVKVNWMLNDPKGYEDALIQLGKNVAATEIEKKLKSAQQTAGKAGYEEPESQSLKKKGMQKQRNIFS